MSPVERIPYLGKDMRSEKRVPVLLVFLFGYIARIPHLLLVRRGSHVAYMKDAWSVIAGVANHDDLVRQAYVEIAGETALLQTEVSIPQLFGVFEDEDPINQKTWVRNLMTSVVRKPANRGAELGVHLDWEHREAVWIPVPELTKWLSGGSPEDPEARKILTDEEHTPDFRLHLERLKSYLERIEA